MSTQPYQPRFLEPKPYSFDLPAPMLSRLLEEFNPRQLVTAFAEKGGQPEKVFGGYGEALAKKSLELGQEYSDRTFEVLRAMFERTKGAYRFPLLSQRFLEIAYLSTQDFVSLPILANNPSHLQYRVMDCTIYKGLTETCGQSVAGEMHCRHACLSLCRTIHEGLGMAIDVAMEASMAADGYCQFHVTPKK